MVRPAGGTHGWCAPFSPEALGKMTLKLRPLSYGARAAYDARVGVGAAGAAEEAEEDAPELYLRLAIAMHGSRRLLTLRSAKTAGAQALQLPHRVVNDSLLLVAFRQPGCEQWDMLGGGEACDYVWDAPEAQHAVQLRAYDPSGSWHATSAPTAYSLEATAFLGWA